MFGTKMLKHRPSTALYRAYQTNHPGPSSHRDGTAPCHSECRRSSPYSYQVTPPHEGTPTNLTPINLTPYNLTPISDHRKNPFFRDSSGRPIRGSARFVRVDPNEEDEDEGAEISNPVVDLAANFYRIASQLPNSDEPSDETRQIRSPLIQVSSYHSPTKSVAESDGFSGMGLMTNGVSPSVLENQLVSSSTHGIIEDEDKDSQHDELDSDNSEQIFLTRSDCLSSQITTSEKLEISLTDSQLRDDCVLLREDETKRRHSLEQSPNNSDTSEVTPDAMEESPDAAGQLGKEAVAESRSSKEMFQVVQTESKCSEVFHGDTALA